MNTATPVTRRDCHWGDIPRPRTAGRSPKARVWICQYPYRTVRDTGPDRDCDGCAIRERIARERAAVPALAADQIALLEGLLEGHPFCK